MAVTAVLACSVFTAAAAPAERRPSTAGKAAKSGPARRSGRFSRPDYLRAGDTVAVVATSGCIAEPGDTARVRQLIESWGLHVKFGQNLADRSHPYFAGCDSLRAADLQHAADDPGTKAIIVYRGGYGAVRLLPLVDFRRLAAHPKWIAGFSDITMLHLLMQRAGIESIHGPMPCTFGFDSEGNPDPSVESLRAALFGELRQIDTPPHPLNRKGHAEGRLAGGNLTILCSAAGTHEALRSDIPVILFIEEVGESAYRIDRMMQQLLRSGALANVKAIVAGHFTGTAGVERFGAESAYDIIDEYARQLGVPAVYGFPAGHESPNTALYLGRLAEIDVTDEGARLKFTE